jgi:hypothetical protein
MKIRDSNAVQDAIDNLIDPIPLVYVDYDNDNSITIDGGFTLDQLKALIHAIESVPGTSI